MRRKDRSKAQQGLPDYILAAVLGLLDRHWPTGELVGFLPVGKVYEKAVGFHGVGFFSVSKVMKPKPLPFSCALL